MTLHSLGFVATSTQSINLSNPAAFQVAGGFHFSLVVWFKGSVTATNQVIFDNRNPSGLPIGFVIYLDVSGHVNFNTFDGVNTITFAGSANVCDGNWHLIVASCDGSTGKLYVDSVLDNSAGGTFGASSGNTWATAAVLGLTPSGLGGAPLNGNVAYFALYSTVLNTGNITGIYAMTLNPRSLSPVMVYLFEEGSGSITRDIASSGCDGTLINSPTWSSTLPTPVSNAFNRSPTIYYVDNAGNDSNTGLIGFPWQTCVKVSGWIFVAGDTVLFTSGQTFAGPLHIFNSGVSSNWIYYGSTGTSVGHFVSWNNPAIITAGAGGANGSAQGIEIWNCEYVWTSSLFVNGPGVNLTNGITTSTWFGVEMFSNVISGSRWAYNRLTSIAVTGCFAGIYCGTPDGATQTVVGYDNLKIYGCSGYANAGDAIDVLQDAFPGSNKTTFTNLYIGYCQGYNNPGQSAGIGGSAISVRNCTTGIVEYCVGYNNNNALGKGATDCMGMSMCSGMAWQFCEMALQGGALGSFDQSGWDCESSDNTLLQYCYIHDNLGSGIEFGDSAGGVTNGDCVIRYNIVARNSNGTGVGDIRDFSNSVTLTMYQNTVYSTGLWPTIYGINTLSCYNNILVCMLGQAMIDNITTITGLIGNVYYANGGNIKIQGTNYTTIAGIRGAGYETHNAANYGTIGDPLLKSPATMGIFLPSNNVSTCSYFDLSNGSPAAIPPTIPLSLLSISPGSIDFHGYSSNANNPNAGAVQPSILFPGVEGGVINYFVMRW